MKKLIGILLSLLALVCVLAACDEEHTHTFGDWSVTTAATCGAKGEETRTCSCGESETREIEKDANNHVWSTWNVTTAATCATKGEKNRTCPCGASETREIPASHALTHHTALAKSCTAAGNIEYWSCGACGKYFSNATGTAEIADKTSVVIAASHTPNADGICAACGQPLTPTDGIVYWECGTYAEVIDYTGTATALLIADTYHDLPVTTVAGNAFANKNIVSVTIPASVTSIGEYAFESCFSLKHVIFAEGSQLTSIGRYAFEGCSSLERVTFAEGSQLTSIGSRAFQYCRSLENITIPASVTSIGYDAFFGCWELVQEENGVSYVENWVVDYDDSLAVISLREGTLGIANGAFDYASRLRSIHIPASVTSIGEYAFDYCTLLERITFAEGSQLTNIGAYAFSECSSLAAITIPAGVTSIGEYTFDYCSSLESVIFAENSQLTSIGEHAFYHCSSLAGISIPAGVTSIGEWAFYDCASLASITIPASVTSIGKYAFSDCSSLTSAIFAATDGWWRALSATATSGSPISATGLSDPATAAEYLTDDYDGYYWNRTVND